MPGLASEEQQRASFENLGGECIAQASSMASINRGALGGRNSSNAFPKGEWRGLYL